MPDPVNANSTTRHDQLIFWGCFLALITTAFAFISRMFLIDTWAVEFGLDQAEKGVLQGIGIWPFAVSIVVFSLFIDKIGYKFAMIFSFVGYLVWSIVGVAAFFISDGGKGDTKLAYQMLYWGSFLLGLSNGTVEAYINPVVATMFNKNKTKWLNILHAGWPGGLVIAGIITIGLGDVDWSIKIGIIAVPAVIFFLMLAPLKFPVNERVASGVTYREMLAEFGFAGAAIVSFLLTLQFISVFPNIPPEVFIALGAAMAIAFGLYTRSVGNPFVFFMALIMMPLATTEIGTDGWITDIMKDVFENLHPGWILVYTSAIMMVLRFCAGPIVHKLSPIGLLIISSALAIVGLLTLSLTAGVMIFAAATLYALGKTFFWPTMLGIVSERSPKGGALTLNALGGIGMLAVGVLGFPYIGILKGDKQISAIANNEEITEAVPGIIDDGELTVLVDKDVYEILDYQAIDNNAVQLLTRPTKEVPTVTPNVNAVMLTDAQLAALPEDFREMAADHTLQVVPEEGSEASNLVLLSSDSLATLTEEEQTAIKAHIVEAAIIAQTTTTPISDEELAALPEDQQKAIKDTEGKIKAVSDASAQGALANMAIFPGIMLIAYLGMFFYFKGQGGYEAKHLDSDTDSAH